MTFTHPQEIKGSSQGEEAHKAGEHDGAIENGSKHIKRKYMVGRVALRTLFFDSRLLYAVNTGPPAAIKQVKPAIHCSKPGAYLPLRFCSMMSHGQIARGR